MHPDPALPSSAKLSGSTEVEVAKKKVAKYAENLEALVTWELFSKSRTSVLLHGRDGLCESR